MKEVVCNISNAEACPTVSFIQAGFQPKVGGKHKNAILIFLNFL